MADGTSGRTWTGSIQVVCFTSKRHYTLFSMCCLGSIWEVGEFLWGVDVLKPKSHVINFGLLLLATCMHLVHGSAWVGGGVPRLKLRPGPCWPPGPNLLAATLSKDGRHVAGSVLVPASSQDSLPANLELRVW